MPKEIGNLLVWPFSNIDYRAEYLTELKEDSIVQKQEIKSLKQKLNDRNIEVLDLKEKVIKLQSTIAEFEEVNKALKRREDELISNQEKLKQAQQELETKISDFEEHKNSFLKEAEIIKETEGRAGQIIDNNSQLRKRVSELENQLREVREKYDQNLRADQTEFKKMLSEERNIFNDINSEIRGSLNLSIYILLAFVGFILLAFIVLTVTWYLRSQNLIQPLKSASIQAIETAETTKKQLEQRKDSE